MTTKHDYLTYDPYDGFEILNLSAGELCEYIPENMESLLHDNPVSFIVSARNFCFAVIQVDDRNRTWAELLDKHNPTDRKMYDMGLVEADFPELDFFPINGNDWEENLIYKHFF